MTKTIKLPERKREISESEIRKAYKKILAYDHAMHFDNVVEEIIETLFGKEG